MSKRKDEAGDGESCPKRHAVTLGHAESEETSWLDCVFQVNHESHANRLISYFENESIRRLMYPVDSKDGSCAVSAEILGYGNAVEKTGNLMIMFHRISLTPKEWTTWMYSSLLRHVVTRMYFLKGGHEGRYASTKEEMVDQLKGSCKITEPIRLTCCPKTLQVEILDTCEKLGDACPLDFHPVTFKHVLHVIQLPDGSLRYSIREPDETYLTRSDETSRIPGQFCRAAGKLQEALLVSGFLGECANGEGIAIDVGAAPGGWTHQLATHMDTVIAIDPAELHPTVLALKNVKHVRKMSQDAGAEIDQIVGDRCISLLSCDANRAPHGLAEMLFPALKYLKRGGLLVITLKFGRKGDSKVAKCVEGLSEAFSKLGGDAKSPLTDMQTLFLLSNTQHERTIVARKA